MTTVISRLNKSTTSLTLPPKKTSKLTLSHVRCLKTGQERSPDDIFSCFYFDYYKYHFTTQVGLCGNTSDISGRHPVQILVMTPTVLGVMKRSNIWLPAAIMQYMTK
jgi:hypothetical protein